MFKRQADVRTQIQLVQNNSIQLLDLFERPMHYPL